MRRSQSIKILFFSIGKESSSVNYMHRRVIFECSSFSFVGRWLETEYGRGVNVIISCLLHFLELHVVPLIEKGELTCIRLFCDSSSGQNKNYAALLALMDFPKRHQIDFKWFFPIRGHSFMPADRSFSFVSRRMKKKRLVLHPEEYDDILQQVGNLFILGQHLTVKDVKTAADKVLQVRIQIVDLSGITLLLSFN